MMRNTILNTSCLLAFSAGLLSFAVGYAATPVATLEKTLGMVMVDHGDGFAIATSGDVVGEGDRIMVMEDSSGDLVSGHCIAHLKSHSRNIIGSRGACRDNLLSAEYPGKFTGTLYAAAIGVVKPKTKTEDIEKPPVDTSTETAEPDQVAKQTTDDETKPDATQPKVSPRAIMIGVGVAAALALIGGGGGGGNAATPDH